MKISIRSSILLLFSLLLPCSCERNELGSATEQAGEEFSRLQEEMMNAQQVGEMSQEEAEEIDVLLQHFTKTADARFATETAGLTMLHLACIYKHAELARCLLLDGANPTAILRSEGFGTAFSDGGITPLQMAVTTPPVCTAEEMLTLVRHLIKAGAKPDMSREGLICENEQVYMEMLKHADKLEDADFEGTPISCGRAAAEHGWVNALRALFDLRSGKLTEGDRLLLHIIAAGCNGNSAYTECAKLLLEKGICADTEDSNGTTPLFALATSSEFQQGDCMQLLPLAELLLSRGADPHHQVLRDPEYPGFTPYDFFLTKPEFLRELKKRGHDIRQPEVNWNDSSNLPREICRAHLRELAESSTDHAANCAQGCTHHHHGSIRKDVSPEIAGNFDAIARILKPDAGLHNHPLYADALAAGIELLAAADAAKTAQLVTEMPLWTDALVWKDRHPHALAALQALTENPRLILPAEFICRAAETMEQQQQYDAAAAMLELLGRSTDAEAVISRYAQHASLCLQAGALQAELLRKGLPAAKCYAVRDWLAAHGLTADTPERKKALLLTSQEDLWLGNMAPKMQLELISAMGEIGAPRAAAAYQAISQALNQPDKLDEITADSHIWKFELECATARYILLHAGQFLAAPEQKTENTD